MLPIVDATSDRQRLLWALRHAGRALAPRDLGRSVGLVAQRVFDARQQAGGRSVVAALLHDLAQLGVEVVRLGARGALVEVHGDLLALRVVELTREQVVDLVQSVVALRLEGCGIGGHGSRSQGWTLARRAGASRRTRTTPSRGPFFSSEQVCLGKE